MGAPNVALSVRRKVMYKKNVHKMSYNITEIT